MVPTYISEDPHKGCPTIQRALADGAQIGQHGLGVYVTAEERQLPRGGQCFNAKSVEFENSNRAIGFIVTKDNAVVVAFQSDLKESDSAGELFFGVVKISRMCRR
jgi:hypothetical protein